MVSNVTYIGGRKFRAFLKADAEATEFRSYKFSCNGFNAPHYKTNGWNRINVQVEDGANSQTTASGHMNATAYIFNSGSYLVGQFEWA